VIGYTEPQFDTIVDLPSCLRGESGASAKPSINLNDTIVQRDGVQRILNITLAHNAEVTYDLNGRLSQHVVLLIG